MLRRVLGVVVGVTLLAVTGPALAGPHHRPRPDLAVTSGSAALSGTTLSGSFVVKAKGHTAAGRSTAGVYVGDQRVAEPRVRKVRPGRARTVAVSVPLPASIGAGTRVVRVCADDGRKLRERSEKNNCRTLGTITVPGAAASSVPTAPLPFAPGEPFEVPGAGGYWVDVPTSYDTTHQTPTTLFVWLHGCGGYSSGDIDTVSPNDAGQTWISVAPDGREGDCWDVDADPDRVLAVVADVKTHFNIAPRRVVLGGYSSGGDLAYRTAFHHALSFAGVLAENTSPFRDTGSSQAASLAAAAWRFPVVHVAHLQDTTYPIAGVRSETDAMSSAGFPVDRIELDGTHYDDPGDVVNGHQVPGTDADVRTYLLPHLRDGWQAPAS